jgi:hypothetical protein
MLASEETEYIQQMLKQKKFKNKNELHKFIMGFEYEKTTGKKRRKVAGYIPRREVFVPKVPEHERAG